VTAKILPARTLRERPDIDQLRRQAKELLAAFLSGEADAVAEVHARYRKADAKMFALHDAQLVLARSYGFESWPKLKAAVDGVTATRLHEAVEKGDLEAARALLARRPEIVDLGRGETRALHMAVLKRDVEMTRLLLEAGADTRGGIWPNRDATSPRTIAQERGYDEIFALIVAEEAKRGARGPGAPADVFQQLGHAMMTGGEQAVVAALNAHPDLSGICPPDGMTLLHQAAGRGMRLVARWLLDHGAEVNRQSRATRWAQGRTPLDVAATRIGGEPFDLSAFEPMAALLVERGAALTPLSAAALGRLDYLAACPRESLQGQFVLEAAVRCNRPDVLRHLLDMGLDPDERTQIGHPEDQTFKSVTAVTARRVAPGKSTSWRLTVCTYVHTLRGVDE
jgi:ankyrin repeat protein